MARLRLTLYLKFFAYLIFQSSEAKNADELRKGNKTMSMFSNLIKAREKQAELSVHAYLAQFDDNTLSRMGVNRKNLKTGGSINHFL